MTTNDKPKDRTGAARQQRLRQRRREARELALRHTVTAVTGQRVTVAARPGDVTMLPPRRAVPWNVAVLAVVALAIGALALVINAQAGWRFGVTPLAAVTFAGLALAADLLAIVLPAAAVSLWVGRRHGLAAAAWATWVVACALAILASVGFVELHTGDTAAGRGAVVATSTALEAQRSAAIAAAQLVLTTAAKQRESECAVRGARCRDREADERIALAALNTAIAAPIPVASTIAAPDPQVTAALRLTTWAGLKLTSDDVLNLRLILMALLPNIAGLVFAFAIGLQRPCAAGAR